MAVYTYQVDHGNSSPSVGAKTEVNGGQLQIVSFSPALDNCTKARDIIDSILWEFEHDIPDEVIEKLNEITKLI